MPLHSSLGNRARFHPEMMHVKDVHAKALFKAFVDATKEVQ